MNDVCKLLYGLAVIIGFVLSLMVVKCAMAGEYTACYCYSSDGEWIECSKFNMTVHDRELVQLLEECLKYVSDGEDHYLPNEASIDLLMPKRVDGAITIKKRELKQLEDATALHKRIEKIIQEMKKGDKK